MKFQAEYLSSDEAEVGGAEVGLARSGVSVVKVQYRFSIC